MDALEAIRRRRSVPKLVEPGPDDDELATLIDAAVAAPDHGKLRPWRFVVMRNTDRLAFGEVLAKSYLQQCEARGETPNNARLDTERNKLMRAPVVIVAIHKAVKHAKISVGEQRDAVVAAIENLLIAATALGFGTMWRTGKMVDDQGVQTALSLAPGDSIVGFIYIGTAPPD